MGWSSGLLQALSGMVIISSYRSPLYERLFSGWNTIEWTGGQFCSANTNSQKRTETVWLNQAAWEQMPQRLISREATMLLPAHQVAEAD